jgi:hypothetical protein
MIRTPSKINPEKLAYWYFRLNGFLQIENFYVHPRGRGGARTDADLLAVRFPFRAERLVDDPNDIMEDDFEELGLTAERIDVVIAEVKTSRCALNGPWTNPARQNTERVLAAIGCVPHSNIETAAESLYRTGKYVAADMSLQVRFVAIGSERSQELIAAMPEVRQIAWDHVSDFIFARLNRYRHQKRQTDAWDTPGRQLKELARRHHPDRDGFRETILGGLRGWNR